MHHPSPKAVGSGRVVKANESQFIGSILTESAEYSIGDAAVPLPSQIQIRPLEVLPFRSTSAPPHLAIDEPAEQTSDNSSEAYRHTAEYYNYYYSQRPLDPRLPLPLYNWSRRNKKDSSEFQQQPHLSILSSEASTSEESPGSRLVDLQQQMHELSLGVVRGQPDVRYEQESAPRDTQPDDAPLDQRQFMSSASDGSMQQQIFSGYGPAYASLTGNLAGAAVHAQFRAGAVGSGSTSGLGISPMMAVMGFGQMSIKPDVTGYARTAAAVGVEYADGYAPASGDAQWDFQSPQWDPSGRLETAGDQSAAYGYQGHQAPFMAEQGRPGDEFMYGQMGSNGARRNRLRGEHGTNASQSLRNRFRREEELMGSSATRRWIDDLRLNKGNSNYSLQHVIQHHMAVELASDQYGSRFIQQRLDTASEEEKQATFLQLLPETYALCKDVFGNYVVQKFLDAGLPDQRNILIQELLGNVLDLSLQMYGCRVIQKAINVADTRQQGLIVRELAGHVMQCVKDQNGNHVIQKCIEKVPAHLIQFIVDSFASQVYQLSTHPYGCRVIQRLLEHCQKDQRNAILGEVLESARELCKNQYGNYVIQHVLIHGTPWHRASIVQSLRGSTLPLSKHKFASNVVEKCFAHASRQDRAMLIDEILGREDDPNSELVSMVKDQFANYVVQKVIDVAEEEQREAIITRIRLHVPNLRKLPYGKHIIARVERITGKPFLP